MFKQQRIPPLCTRDVSVATNRDQHQHELSVRESADHPADTTADLSHDPLPQIYW
jgi:hypothetical protein